MIDSGRQGCGGIAEQLADLIFDEAMHLYTLDGKPVPGVTHVLDRTKLIDYAFLGVRRSEYLERGRRVHQATHADDLGQLDENTQDSEIMGYVEGWRKFRADYGFVPHLIEQRVCNREHGFAGTLDRTGEIRTGEQIILDIKSGIAPQAVRYQLAAYASCLLHPRTRRRRCVELHRSGTYRVIGFETADYYGDFARFCLALRLYHTLEDM